MGRGYAQKSFARALAGLGLAAAISISCIGTAGAAPADRAGDAVVIKGSGLSGLVGSTPGELVGFKWARGAWAQIPVQVDERHKVDVRQLYPPQTEPAQVGSGYVGGNNPAFELEVYADPKTRSGADEDPTFDADDELTFMGGDAGTRAPADAGSPKSVDGTSGVRVKVDDPSGGGDAFVYLFKSRNGLDQSAGKDYVDYDFKLTNLPEGGTLLNDYGYYHSFNPEDSTVKTANYKLHSVDRWMEDEMKITAGDADGTDILDREVAQATLFGCSRSEYTFSGRWTQDSWAGNDTSTDDEGTYVTVIDGPVRAIRSYMGANSGPYVQREHIYYADHEVNNIYLRVHPMLDLYAWTDYSEAAIGMTYRDAKNTSGVTIDGAPDTLAPTTSADVANGAYSWQQVSGPQGTVSTVIGTDTDIPNASFGNYYLDQSSPSGGEEVQCGGDGKSIGASGFGILGPVTPNTDPRNGEFNNLTVKRTRYFDAPSAGAKQAAEYTKRVSKPMTTSSAASPFTGGPSVKLVTKLKVSLPGKKAKAKRGKAYRVKVRVANSGNLAAKPVKVCVRGASLKGKGACRSTKVVAAGRAKVVVVKVKVKPNAKGSKLRLKVTAESKFGKSKASKQLAVPLASR